MNTMPKTITCPCCNKELTNRPPNKTKKYFHAWCDTCQISIAFNVDSDTPVSIENDLIRADWYDAGEGICGDYNPDDPDDIHLLRFDIYKKNHEISNDLQDAWEEVEDASYCTRMPYNTNQNILTKSLSVIFKNYYDILKDDPNRSVKKLGEALSWICPNDVMAQTASNA